MEKMVKIRGSSFDVAWVTTATNLKFEIIFYGEDYSIDWGNGIVENNVTSHTYIDGLSAHTISIYGNFNGAGSEIYTFNQNLIYADISRCPDLKVFRA